jgi:hypothetical protein
MATPDLRERLVENLSRIRGRMADAARRSGRDPADVVLVAVTKYVDAEQAAWLPGAGCCELGESRPQSLWTKAAAVADPGVHWHLIGHLQRNKIRRTLPWLSWIHSVDSRRLLDALQQEAEAAATRVRVLLEVNVAGESAKTGFALADMLPLADQFDRWPRLRIEGLMAMAALEGDADAARRDFSQLRELRDAMQRHCPPHIQLQQLSMGMSGDYEVAIEEGATMVRVGSAVWEGLLT